MILNKKLLLLVLVACLGACGGERKNVQEDSKAAPAAAAQAPATKDATEAQMTSMVNNTNQDAERKFIRTADARFSVKDVYQSSLAIEDAVQAVGGFVTSNHVSANPIRKETYAKGDGNIIEIAEYQVAGDLIVRVPSNKAQEFLRAIASQIEFLDERTFTAQDVQFDMLRQKIETATADTKSERSNSKVSELELNDQVNFATVKLNLYQPNKVHQTEHVDIDTAFKDNRPNFFKQLWSSMSTGWYFLLDCIVVLMSFWPLFGLLVLGVIGKKYWDSRSAGLRKNKINSSDN